MTWLLFTALLAHAGELGRNATAPQPTATQATAMPKGYTTASVDGSEANMCSVIRKLGGGNPDKFDTKNPYGLCAPTWHSPTPEWYRPEIAAEIQKVGTADYKLTSRTEFMQAKGYKLLNQTQKDGLLELARNFREQAAKDCCGSNAPCLTAMRAVRLEICESPADHDPSLEDPCEADNGEFRLTTFEQAKVVTMLRGSSLAAIKEAKAILGTSDQKFPVSGVVQFSPYTKSTGETISSSITLRHEFGHACSFVQRQIASGKSFEATQSFLNKQNSKCAASATTYAKAYSGVFKNSHVLNCLIDAANQSTNQRTASYVPHSCPVDKVEEAAAEAFALTTMPLVPEAFPNRACSGRPSRIHVASTDVFTCLVNSDSKFRKNLAEKFRCQ